MSLEGSRFVRHGEGELPEVPCPAEEGIAIRGDSARMTTPLWHREIPYLPWKKVAAILYPSLMTGVK